MDIANSSRRKVEITRVLADSAQPLGRAYRIHDTKQHGLSLKVHPTGRRVWCLDWARNKSINLGLYPHVTVAAARERARVALVERDTGGAPVAARPSAAGADTPLGEFIDGETVDGKKVRGDEKDGQYATWLRADRPNAENDLAELRAQFKADFFSTPLAGITVAAVDAWRARRLTDDEVKPSTVRRALVRLKGVLSKAVAWGALEASPLEGLKLKRDEPSGIVRYLSVEEEARMRAALAARDLAQCAVRDELNAARAPQGLEPLPGAPPYIDHLTPLVLVAMNTGMRRGELTGIRWTNIDFPGKRLTIPATIAKSKKPRHIPLNTEAMAVLRTWHESTPYDDLRPFPFASSQKAWERLLAKASISEFRFHDLRHHFASKLVMGGVSLSVVRELLGHSNFEMTLRYAHLAPEHHAQAVESLVAKPAKPAPTIIEQVKDADALRALVKQLAAKLEG